MSFEFEFGVFTHEVTHERYSEFGSCIKELWTKNAVIHRSDGPAVLYRDENTAAVLQEEYYKDGLLHRVGGPAKIEYRDGAKKEHWMRDGKYHRDDGPAFIETLANGVVRLESWHLNGLSHRIGGPSAIVRYPDTGEIKRESWEIDGRLHREDGPAGIERDETTGIVVEEDWMQNGIYYREGGGPTCITRCGKTGDIVFEENPENEEQTPGASVESDNSPSP